MLQILKSQYVLYTMFFPEFHSQKLGVCIICEYMLHTTNYDNLFLLILLLLY